MRGQPRKSRTTPPSAAKTARRNRDLTAALDAVRRLVRALRVSARQAEDESGLSPAQLYVLGQIAALPGCSLSELAERTLTDRTSVRAMVERLLARGLVSRGTGESDRRRVEIRLTDAGRRILARAPRAPTQHLLAGLDNLDDASLSRLAASLGDLLAAIGAADEPPTMLFEEEPRRSPSRRRRPTAP